MWELFIFSTIVWGLKPCMCNYSWCPQLPTTWRRQKLFKSIVAVRYEEKTLIFVYVPCPRANDDISFHSTKPTERENSELVSEIKTNLISLPADSGNENKASSVNWPAQGNLLRVRNESLWSQNTLEVIGDCVTKSSQHSLSSQVLQTKNIVFVSKPLSIPEANSDYLFLFLLLIFFILLTLTRSLQPIYV